MLNARVVDVFSQSTLDDVAAEGVNELPFFLAIFALPFLLTILLTLAEDAG